MTFTSCPLSYRFCQWFLYDGKKKKISCGGDELTTANRELKKPSLPRVNLYNYHYTYNDTGEEVMEKTKERDTRPWRFTKA